MSENTIDERSGLTYREQWVMDSLVSALNAFVRLESKDDDIADFRRAIHECQRILMARTTRRNYPQYYRPNNKNIFNLSVHPEPEI